MAPALRIHPRTSRPPGAGADSLGGEAATPRSRGATLVTIATAGSWHGAGCSPRPAKPPRCQEASIGQGFDQRELVRFGKKVMRSGKTANRTIPATMIHTNGQDAR